MMNDLLAEYAATEVKIEQVQAEIKQVSYDIWKLKELREEMKTALKDTKESLDELRLSVALDITRSARHGTRASEIKQSNLQ